MRFTLKLCRSFFLSGITIIAFQLCVSLSVAAQQEQGGDSSRQIIAEEFTRSRPERPKPSSAGANSASSRQGGSQSNLQQRKPRYRRSTVTNAVNTSKTPANAASSSNAVTLPASSAKVGVTVWRLRTGQAADQGARLLVQGDEGELIPERINVGTPLRVRDRVRLSIESPREGYLYVVDREMYSDGSLGEPYLIFPTTRTRGGDNRVRPGKLIDIPAQDDRPNYFTLIPTPGRDDQVGEMLSFIVTTEPLENFEATSKPLKLSPAQVQNWEKMWGGRTEQYDLEGGEGQTWTRAESEASKSDGSRLLTQEEPTPQTVYLVEGRNNKGLLVNVPLRYSR